MGRSSDLSGCATVKRFLIISTSCQLHFQNLYSPSLIMPDYTPESANVRLRWYPLNCPVCHDPEDICYYRVPRRALCHRVREMTLADAKALLQNLDNLQQDLRERA